LSRSFRNSSHGPQQRGNLPPRLNRLGRIAAVLECVGVTLGGARRLSAVQSTPAVRHRGRLAPAPLPCPRSASAAEVRDLLCMGLILKFWVSPHPPGPDHADDSFAAGMHVDVLHPSIWKGSILRVSFCIALWRQLRTCGTGQRHEGLASRRSRMWMALHGGARSRAHAIRPILRSLPSVGRCTPYRPDGNNRASFHISPQQQFRSYLAGRGRQQRRCAQEVLPPPAPAWSHRPYLSALPRVIPQRPKGPAGRHSGPSQHHTLVGQEHGRTIPLAVTPSAAKRHER
jgi:hypothetical protein